MRIACILAAFTCTSLAQAAMYGFPVTGINDVPLVDVVIAAGPDNLAGAKEEDWMDVFLAAIALSMCLCACATTRPSLYESLGGEAGIERICGRFVAALTEDQAIRPDFEHSNPERSFDKFSEHLCAAADGPCGYTGDGTPRVHHGMDINESDFNRVVDLMIEAMNDEGIPHGTQNRLLKRLAPLRREIVYR